MDTYPIMTDAMQFVSVSLACPMPEESIFKLMKQSLSVCVKELSERSGCPEAEVHALFRAEEKKRMPFAGVMECVPEILKTLDRSGVWHFLATHRSKDALDMLRKRGMLSLFRGWVTHEDGFPRKPDPAGLQFLMHMHGLSPLECCMVGDRPLDVEAGERAGMRGILLDREHLFPAGTGRVCVYSGGELKALLMKITTGVCKE